MAKRKKPPARRSQQRTMFDAAKSGAVQMQNMALKAATAAATAAAEAAVQAVMRTLSRKTARGADPKKEQNHSSGSAQEKTLVRRRTQGHRTSHLSAMSDQLVTIIRLADAHNRASAFRILDYLL